MKKKTIYIAPQLKMHSIGSKGALMDNGFIDFKSAEKVEGGELNGKVNNLFEDEDSDPMLQWSSKVWDSFDD